MNLMTFITPLSLGVVIILGVFLLVQLALDSRRANQQRMFRRLALASVRKHESRTVSVMVELTRNADTILPLLDHLENQAYEKLQVVVIVKHTAGKNATPALRRYQRAHKNLRLRVVTHRKGMDKRLAIKRFATGELIAWMSSNERLSKDFFTAASLRFMDQTIDGLQVRQHARIGSSIASALKAWTMIQQDMALTLRRPVHGATFIVRREQYLAGTVNRIAYGSNTALQVDTRARDTGKIRSQLPFFIILMAAAIAGYMIGPSTLPYLVIAPFLGLFLLMSTQLSSTQGYGFSDRLNLLLLLPLFPFLTVIYRIINLVRKLPLSRHMRIPLRAR